MLNIGLCLQAKGEYRLAVAAYLESLRLKKMGPQGEESMNYALSLSTLAGVYQEMCEFDSAEKHLLRAMPIQKRLRRPATEDATFPARREPDARATRRRKRVPG